MKNVRLRKNYTPFENIYKMANKIGLLKHFKRRTFRSNWREFFFVLTNIGILRFYKPNDR